MDFSKVMRSLLKEAVNPDGAKYHQFRQDQLRAGVNRNEIPELKDWQRQQQGNNQSIQNRQQSVVGNNFLPNGRLRKPPRREGGQGLVGYQVEEIIKDGLLPKLKEGNYKHIDANSPDISGKPSPAVKTDIIDDKGTGNVMDNTAYSVKTKRNNEYPMKVHQTFKGGNGFNKTYRKLKMKRGQDPLLDEAMDMYLGKGGNFVSPADMENKHVEAIIKHLTDNKTDIFDSITRQAEHAADWLEPEPYISHDPHPVHKLIQHKSDGQYYYPNGINNPSDLSGEIDIRHLAGKVNESNFEPLKWMHDGKRFFLGEEENAPTDKRMLDLWQIDEEGSNWTMNEGDKGPNPNDEGNRGRGIVEPGHFKATMATNPDFLDKYFPVEKRFRMDDDGNSLGFTDITDEERISSSHNMQFSNDRNAVNNDSIERTLNNYRDRSKDEAAYDKLMKLYSGEDKISRENEPQYVQYILNKLIRRIQGLPNYD